MTRTFNQDPSPTPIRAQHTHRPKPSAPEPQGVPSFDPLRVQGARDRLRRAVLRRRRAMAAGLAVTAATLAATGAGGAAGAAGPGGSAPGAGSRSQAAAKPVTGVTEGATPQEPLPSKLVSTPVRIADAETVRLLRRGDRVDVIASPVSPAGPLGGEQQTAQARVVAAGAKVTEIPDLGTDTPEDGALLVLSVPRATATALAGANATSQLAVTLC